MKKKFAAALLGLVSMLTGCGGAPVDYAQYTANGGLLIDVRTPAEYAEGHAANAVNKPVQTIDQWIKELTNKDQEIYVYCRSGARSSRAAKILKDHGFKNVTDLGAYRP